MNIQYTEKYNMGFLMPKVSMPALPAAPAAMPDVPKYDDADRKAEAAAKRARIRSARTGRSSTILTGASGLEDDDSLIQKKTLLGG
jgi:hypothetical protein